MWFISFSVEKLIQYNTVKPNFKRAAVLLWFRDGFGFKKEQLKQKSRDRPFIFGLIKECHIVYIYQLSFYFPSSTSFIIWSLNSMVYACFHLDMLSFCDLSAENVLTVLYYIFILWKVIALNICRVKTIVFAKFQLVNKE